MRLVFLDRDGVINEDRELYVTGLNDLVVFPYTPSAIARLTKAGFSVFVVSNQQGVAKGVYGLQELDQIEVEIRRLVEAAGGCIEKFYYCTHFASDNCDCRKPKPGMLLAAAREYGLEFSEAIIIGDNYKDILAGKSVGCRAVLVLTGMACAADVSGMSVQPDYVASDLEEAVDWVVGLEHPELSR